MSYFRYTVVNQAKKQLTGTIEAPDETTARHRLNDLQFSIISLENIGATAPIQAKGSLSFEFEALNHINKKVAGTITAASDIEAYTRLVDEYQMTVQTLYPSLLSETEKNQKRAEGIMHLQTAYEKQRKQQKKSRGDEGVLSDTSSITRTEILERVTATINKIQTFLIQYGPDLKLEERAKIKGYIDQLMRIKDSTNLEHIINTCENMLTYIQNHEVFQESTHKVKERATINVETKQLLAALGNRGLKQEINLRKILLSLKDHRIFGPFARFIFSWTHADDPEIMTRADQVEIINKRIWAYVKIWLRPKNSAFRSEASSAIRALLAEKRKLKDEMKIMRYQIEQSTRDTENELSLGEKVIIFTGWLLAFYIVYYGITFSLTMKQWNLPELPQSFFVYDAPFFKTVILLLFIVHSAMQLKKLFFQQSFTAALTLIPLSAIGFVLLLVNFII